MPSDPLDTSGVHVEASMITVPIPCLASLLYYCTFLSYSAPRPTYQCYGNLPASTSLGLTWTNGFSGSSDITGVEIEYKETVVTVGISLMEISIPGDASLESTYLTNLLPFQKLQYLWYTFNLSQTSTPKVDRLISKINYTLMGS